MSTKERRKHTSFHVLLEALRNAAGCPLCDIEAESTKRYFESLLHENVNDVGVREALSRSRGYCPRHAHYLRNHGHGLGIAILYQDQIKLFLRSLEGLDVLLPRKLHREARVRKAEDCPACRMQLECRSRYTSVLTEWLDDSEMRSALVAGRGFCVPHFLALLAIPMDPEARVFLIETQRKRTESLLADLKEFHRKHDYRFGHEGFGSESDSWSRAVRFMVGEDGVF